MGVVHYGSSCSNCMNAAIATPMGYKYRKPPQPLPSDRKPRVWEAIANTPRLLQLVWTAAPVWFVTYLTITLVGSLIPVAQLYVTKLIVDQVVSAVDPATVVDGRVLLMLLGMGFGLTLGQSGVSQSNLYVSQVLEDKFNLYATNLLLQQAARLDLAHYELPEFHDILSRAQTSGSNYPTRVLGTLTNLAGQCITFAGLLTLLLRFNPVILLLLVLSSLPAFWVGVNFSGRRFWMLRHQTQSGRLADYLQQVLLSEAFVKEVRLFDLSHHLLHQWRSIRTQFNQESAELAARQGRARFGIGLLANLGYYGAYAWVIFQAVQRTITIGDLTMYSGAFQQAQGLMQQILFNLALTYESNLYVSQYFEFLNLTPAIANRPNPMLFPTPIRKGLVLHHVTFTYPGAQEPTLKDLNLEVYPGESIALVGMNGAGKTTLLKLLTRFYDVDSGEISIDGIPLTDLELGDLRRNVGVVFQDFARYNLSVQDNIGFGDIAHWNDRDRITQAAFDAGATDIILKLDRGYDTILGKTFPDSTELSGGQWQKIGLSRAFMSRAQVLILDEPTAALDAIAEYDLFQRFRQLTQGKMTFLVSHRFSTVRMADRIVVLQHGRIVEVGSHHELMTQQGLYAHMFNLQASSYQDGLPQESIDS